MKRTLIALLLVILPSFCVPTLADVAPTSLEKLTKISTLAVVVDVKRISTIEGAKIAEAEVLMALKGASRPKEIIYFIAQPTSIEDTSHAVTGDRLLLFLEPEPMEVNPDSQFRSKVRDEIGDRLLWRITWSGRGRLTVTQVNGIDYIQSLADQQLADVRMPKGLTVIPSPTNNRRVNLIKLADVVSFIRRKVKN